MKFIDELRQLYREKKMDELKRLYELGKWRLEDKDRENIEKVLNKKTQSLLDYCESIGWKKVK
jgi:hypothetical protein